MTSVVMTGRLMKISEMFTTWPRAEAALISTFEPGARRSWPSVTTRSPAERPFATTENVPCVRWIVTGRVSTVRSDFTT